MSEQRDRTGSSWPNDETEQVELDGDSKALDAALAADDGQRIDFDDYLETTA